MLAIDRVPRTVLEPRIDLVVRGDARDVDALAGLSTPQMFEELRAQLCEYGTCMDRTEVRALDALLLGYEQRERLELVCVEFSGMIREQPSAGPSPFREVWNMTKPKDGRSGWLVAGVQALA